mgnify:CR=1 FL=1
MEKLFWERADAVKLTEPGTYTLYPLKKEESPTMGEFAGYSFVRFLLWPNGHRQILQVCINRRTKGI